MVNKTRGEFKVGDITVKPTLSMIEELEECVGTLFSLPDLIAENKMGFADLVKFNNILLDKDCLNLPIEDLMSGVAKFLDHTFTASIEKAPKSSGKTEDQTKE